MFDGPWHIEIIPNEECVFRQVHWSQLNKQNKKRRFPNESHFIPDKDGLSVNWERYCTENHVYVIIGLTKKPNGQFKNPLDYKVFKFNVGLLRSIEGIDNVIHDPKFWGNPPVLGTPNNRSHSLIKYLNDEELRLKLSDLVREGYDYMICTRDIKVIESELEELRKRIEELQ